MRLLSLAMPKKAIEMPREVLGCGDALETVHQLDPFRRGPCVLGPRGAPVIRPQLVGMRAPVIRPAKYEARRIDMYVRHLSKATSRACHTWSPLWTTEHAPR